MVATTFFKQETSYLIPGRDTWVNFCWVCATGPSEPYSITVYSVANYRPHLSHFWANM